MEYLYHGGEQTVSMDTTVPPGFLSNIPNMTRWWRFLSLSVYVISVLYCQKGFSLFLIAIPNIWANSSLMGKNSSVKLKSNHRESEIFRLLEVKFNVN